MEKDGGQQDLLCGRPWCRAGQFVLVSYQCYLGACACSLIEHIMRRMVIPNLALLAVIFRPATRRVPSLISVNLEPNLRTLAS
jgi:hypothetical protein